ncbi:MAG: hypothetical protein HWN67_11360 [Candidatus Helarchaeota archaeon]|nr:hypothetical protein [Candidatus Helarchaeota archaeon]
MLISILALIGLFFIIIKVYDKGRKDGILEAVKYFTREMKKREINAEVIIDNKDIDELEKSKKLFKIPFLRREKK